MNNRVLVTGASGFIGRNTLAPLLARGCEVHAVTSHSVTSQRSSPLEISHGLHWHQADLLNSQQVSSLLTQIEPTSLLHSAWYAVPGDYWTSPVNIQWLQASIHLFNEFVRVGGKRIVIAGTCAEYDWTYGYCTEELTPLKQASLYGVSKHALQLVVSTLAQQKQISAAWGRIFWLYGPYEHPNRLIASIMRSLVQGQPALCSHGNQIRDYSHVEDVAGALVALLCSDVEGAVNLASGMPIAVREIALAIGEIAGQPDLIRLGARPAPANEAPLVVANVSRLANEVGWKNQFDLKSGLNQVFEWWKAQETRFATHN